MFQPTTSFQSSAAMKGLMGEPAVDSWEVNEMTDMVEDVFNDAQLLQSRINEDDSMPTLDERISILPDIHPAE